MAKLDFNAPQFEAPADDKFAPLPDGEYEAVIMDSDVKDTKAGTGQYLKLVCEVTGPTHSGRKVFANVNISNPNPQAVEIGQKELKAICIAVGKGDQVIKDSQELHNIPVVIKVLRDKKDDTQNRIVAWKPKTAPVIAPANSGKAPWQK